MVGLELKPCPFCGCNNIEVVNEPSAIMTDCYGCCTKCKARGPNAPHFTVDKDKTFLDRAEELWDNRDITA